MMRVLKLCLILMVAFVPAGFAEDMVGIRSGVMAPDFEAADFRGEMVRLSDRYKDGPVILVFYRGSWCPYCNAQLQQLQSRLADFKQYGASVMAVSVDVIDKAAEPVEKFDLKFDVISNPEGNIIKAYNLAYYVPDKLNKKYKEEYKIDLEAASGRTDHLLAIPAAYIIDTDGMIVYSYVNEDYKVRASLDEVLEKLKSMQE